MKRRTGFFLLLLSAAVIYLLYLVVFRPSGRYFVFCNLTEYFWIPALGALLCLLLGCAASGRARRNQAAGKPARLSRLFSVLQILLMIGQAGLAAYRLIRMPESSRLRKVPDPSGVHCIYRYEVRDLLGNSCYHFLSKQGMFFGTYLFDWDKELPEIKWNGDFLTFRGTTFHLAGNVVS